ncbi:MAG TPA: hypothetical protein VHT05_01155 [Candidatus Elarobacter sp.]|jgi:hypothetical protein|nr:hypothetical protein [Candidatus Elarobacter sp.]
MHDDPAVPIVAIFFVFGLPVAAFIITRILRHAERIEMIRRGIVPPPDYSSKRAYREWRRAGGNWPPPGMQQQTPFVQPTAPTAPAGWGGPDDDPQRAMFKGIRLALIGFAITLGLGYGFGSHTPILLGGLIPMFVGVSQIIIALLSGAQFPLGQPRVTFMPPPPPPGPGAPPPQPPPGYGTATPPPWAQQPGRQHFEELSRPVQPPDVR